MDFNFADPFNSLTKAMDAASRPSLNAFRNDINDSIIEHEAVSALIYAFGEAGITVGSQLADQIVSGVLKPSAVVTAEDISIVEESSFGPYIYTMTVLSQEVNACSEAANLKLTDTSSAMCNVTVALTLEAMFEEDKPTGADPANGPTTVTLSDFHINIKAGTVSNGYLTLSFAPALNGDHLAGSLNAELDLDKDNNDAFLGATLNLRDFTANIPVSLTETSTGKDIGVDAIISLSAGRMSVDYAAGESGEPNTVSLTALLGDLVAAASLNIADTTGRSISATLDGVAAVPAGSTSTYGVQFGGNLESDFEVVGESGDDFLGLTVDADVTTTMPATDISFTQTRTSADTDTITDLSTTSGGETVTISNLEFNEDGTVAELEATNTTKDVSLSVSTDAGSRSGTVEQGGATVGTVSDADTGLSVEYTDDVTEEIDL